MYTSFLTSSEDDHRRRGQYPVQSFMSDEESQWESEGVTRRRVDAGTPSYLLSMQEEEDMSFYESRAGGRSQKRRPTLPEGGFYVSKVRYHIICDLIMIHTM